MARTRTRRTCSDGRRFFVLRGRRLLRPSSPRPWTCWANSLRAVCESNIGRSTPSTRRRPRNCIWLISTQVERGADINTVDRAGMNPLFAPCFSDDLRAVDALLKLGADPHRPFLFFDATMQASLSQVAATIRMAPRVIQALRDAEAQPSDDAAPSAPLPQMEIKCRACGTKQGRFRKCSRCKAAHYCSVECQKYDWQFHKRTCKPCVAPGMPASLSAGLASGRF